MVVDQPWQDAPASEVDDLGVRTCQRHHVLVGVDGEEVAVPDRDGGGGRVRACERREQAVMQDQISGRCRFGHVPLSGSESMLGLVAAAWRPGRRPKMCGVLCVWRHAAARCEPASMCLATGMICSPM